VVDDLAVAYDREGVDEVDHDARVVRDHCDHLTDLRARASGPADAVVLAQRSKLCVGVRRD